MFWNPRHLAPSPSSPSRRPRHGRKATRQPSLEALEDRTVPASFTPKLTNLTLIDTAVQTVRSLVHTTTSQPKAHSSDALKVTGSFADEDQGPNPTPAPAPFLGPSVNPPTTPVSPLPGDTTAKTLPAPGTVGGSVVGTVKGVIAGGSGHLPEGILPTPAQTISRVPVDTGTPSPTTPDSGNPPALGAARAGVFSASPPGTATPASPSDWLAAPFFTQPPLGARLSGGASAEVGLAGARFVDTARAPGEGAAAGLLSSFAQGGDTLDDLGDEQIKDLLAADPGLDPAWGAEPPSALDLSVALLTGGPPRADILPAAGSRVNPVVTLLGREEGVDKIGDEPAPGGERAPESLLIRAPGVGREEEREVAPAATEAETLPPPSAARRVVHAVALTAALVLSLALCARRDEQRADPRPAPRRSPGQA